MFPDPLKPDPSGLTLGPILILVPTLCNQKAKKPKPRIWGPHPFDHVTEGTVTARFGICCCITVLHFLELIFAP